MLSSDAVPQDGDARGASVNKSEVVSLARVGGGCLIIDRPTQLICICIGDSFVLKTQQDNILGI